MAQILVSISAICTGRRGGLDSGGAVAPGSLYGSTRLKVATECIVTRGASDEASLLLDARLLTTLCRDLEAAALS